MEAPEFIDLLESPVKAKNKGIDELKKLAQQYPYSQPIQLLYAIRLRKSSEHLFHQQLGKASILTNNREVLFNLFEQEQEGFDLIPKQVEEKELEKPARVQEWKTDLDKKEELATDVEEDEVTTAEEELEENEGEGANKLKPIEPIKVENNEQSEKGSEKEEEQKKEKQQTEEDKEESEETSAAEPRKERDLSSLSADERIKAILERNRKLREDFESKKQKGEAPLSDIDERLNKIKERLNALKRTPDEHESSTDENAHTHAFETKEEEAELNTVQENISEVVESSAEQVADQIEAAEEEVADAKQIQEETLDAVQEDMHQEEHEDEKEVEGTLSPEMEMEHKPEDSTEELQAESAEEEVENERSLEQSETLVLNEEAEAEMTKVLVVEEDEVEAELNSPEEAKEDTETEEHAVEETESATEENAISLDEEKIKEETNLEAEALVEAHKEEDTHYAPAFIIGDDEEEDAVEEQEVLNESEEKEAQASEEDRKAFVLESTETDTAGETHIELAKEQMSFSEWLAYLNKQSKSVKNANLKSAQTLAEETSFEDKVQLLDSFVEKLPSLKKKVSPGPKSTPIEIGNLVNQGNDRLVTETLAKVYIEQKHYKKAIKAYQILKLKYPEKSSFFASQISEIKKLKDFK